MGAGRRKFTKEFKEAAVRRLGLGASLGEVARACEVNPNVLHRWRRELQDYGTKAFAGNGQRRADESQVAELERKVGRQALEIDFLRRSSGSRWSFLTMAGPASPPSWRSAAARPITSACTGSCARTICFACGGGSLLWPPRTRTTPGRYIRIWRAR